MSKATHIMFIVDKSGGMHGLKNEVAKFVSDYRGGTT